MHILITGITGRIGANLAATLIQDGHQIRGLVWERDRRIEKLKHLDIEFIAGSLTNPEDVASAVKDMEAVYHLGAAFQGGGPFDTKDYFEINVRGTFNMLEAARVETKLKHFLLASTDSVYRKSGPNGMAAPIKVDSNLPEPSNWYALSKTMAEELCIGYSRSHDMPTTVLRFSNTQGAGEFVNYGAFWLGKMRSRPELKPLWTGDEKLVLCTDKNGRPWKKHMADVRDIVHGCESALGKETTFGEVFQLAGPSAFTWDEVIPYISAQLDVPFIEAPLNGNPTYYEYDLSKPKELFGFSPSYDFRRMVDDSIAFNNGLDIGVLPA